LAGKERTTQVFDLPVPPRTPEAQIRALDAMVRKMMQDLMETLRNEAATISNDMDALVVRLEQGGHEAELEDIKSARWYRASAQLSIMKRYYGAFCAITKEEGGIVMLPIEDADSQPAELPEASKTDDTDTNDD
jgi:hypothetical protein